MKTAMQELIDYFSERPEYDKTSEGYEIIEKAKELLEKEKEQIIDAWVDGRKDGYQHINKKYGEEYYNEKYNNQTRQNTTRIVTL